MGKGSSSKPNNNKNAPVEPSVPPQVFNRNHMLQISGMPGAGQPLDFTQPGIMQQLPPQALQSLPGQFATQQEQPQPPAEAAKPNSGELMYQLLFDILQPRDVAQMENTGMTPNIWQGLASKKWDFLA